MYRVRSFAMAFNYLIFNYLRLAYLRLNYLRLSYIHPVLMSLFDRNLLFLVLGCIIIIITSSDDIQPSTVVSDQ